MNCGQCENFGYGTRPRRCYYDAERREAVTDTDPACGNLKRTVIK